MAADLKSLASDMDTFLKVVSTPAKKPEPKVEQTAAPAPVVDPGPDYAKLVRGAWNYVSSQMEEQDSPRLIGETFMVAVAALSKDADVPLDKLNAEAIEFLESIVESAREGL